ncbi:Rieske (2Fe-2S) protein [Deinococcus taklimakanensis]|uniref:Rieske (2Fe-2S) protein n=1 Tax=Deinococcus taklimakanensis TaxID=536443 RepID=A0ABW5P651_9DEIO
MTRYKREDPEITRRKFINAALGASAAVGTVSLLSTLGGANPVFRLTPKKAPPMPGDVLVHAVGEKAGQPVTVADLGEELVRAWPMGKDKEGNDVVRDGEPTGILAIYKFPAGEIKAPTRLEGTIDGQIVAYSDRCTHAGCNVGEGKAPSGKGIMNCPCHSGQYEPREGCKVIGGPPPAPLPQLPIKLEGDKLVATSFFVSRPFGYATDEDWVKYTEQVKELLS